MNGSLHLASFKSAAASGGRIVSAVKLFNRTVFVLDHFFALDEVSALHSYFVAREQTEILLHRLLHEVGAIHVNLPRKRNLASTHLRNLSVVLQLDHLALILRIVGNHHFDRIFHHVSAFHFGLQILPDAVFQQRDFHHTVGLGHADPLTEIPDGFRRVASAAKSGDRRHPRIVPSVHRSVIHEGLQIPFAHHRIGQIQSGKLDLLRRVVPPAYLA